MLKVQRQKRSTCRTKLIPKESLCYSNFSSYSSQSYRLHSEWSLHHSKQLMWSHRLENDPCPQISTGDSSMDLWHCACSMIKDASTKGEFPLSDSPLPSRGFHLWCHEHTSIPSLPARDTFLHSCPPVLSCFPETWVREPPPVLWAWGNPARLLGIFWGSYLPLAGCARHKPQVS